MSRIEALKGLTAKVEAGEFPAEVADAAFPSGPVGAHQLAKAQAAFFGSLDAAKALHDAVLPGWTVTSMFQLRHHTNGQKPTGKWEVGLIGIFPGRVHYANAQSDNPARAWLLAILRALIAQEESE